jgi:20S proteasome alpha/beta subunit
MTVGVVIKCSEGIVLACDSLSTFGRGVSVSKYQKKIHIVERNELA